MQKISNFYSENTTNQNAPASINVSVENNVLLNQRLTDVEFTISYLQLNNKLLPSFIPENVHEGNQSYLNSFTGAQSGHTANDELNILSLKYFVVLRKQDNTKAYKVYLQHQSCYYPQYAPVPSSVQSGAQYLGNKYYWYPNVEFFVYLVVQQALNLLMMLPSPALGLTYTIDLNRETQQVTLVTNNNSGDWMLEFSATLCDILGFPLVESPYLNGSFTIVNWKTNAENNNQVTAPIYSNCLSYSSIILKLSDDSVPLDTETFAVGYKNVMKKEKIIFDLGVTPNPFNKDAFLYTNNCNIHDRLMWRSFVSDIAQSQRIKFDFNIEFYYVIQRDGRLYYFPYLLAPNEKIKLKILFLYKN